MQSEKLAEISQALAKVQSALSPSSKSGTNPAFGGARKYSTLADVWDAVRKLLSDNDLSVAQGVDQAPVGTEHPILWTMLMHKSGEFIRSEMPMLLSKKDPQGVGAAMTYYRRYSLAAMVGVTQEDDDANSAMPAKDKPAQRPASPPPAAGAQDRAKDDERRITAFLAEIERAKTETELQAVVNKVFASYLPAEKKAELKKAAGVRKSALLAAPAAAAA